MKVRVTWIVFALTLVTYLSGNPEHLWLQPDAQWWQFITYALCHANGLHLALNLLALLSFGPTLERAWGWHKFLWCYIFCAVAGGALQHLMSDKPIVGASGALFGLFAAYTLQNPKAKVISLIPYLIPAWMILVLYMALSVLAYAMAWLPTVGHLVHLGGAAVGIAFALHRGEGAKR